MHNDRCEWCGGLGYVTVYHKLYANRPRVDVEWTDRFTGECRVTPMPGIVLAHCFCDRGTQVRAQVHEDERRRIPLLQDCLAGRGWYLPVEPDWTPDETLSESGREFIRRWLKPHRKRFGINAPALTGIGADWGKE